MSTWWTDSSRSSGSMPSEKVRQACGSRSTSSTGWPSSASAAPIEATVVVLATPPFWLAIASVVRHRGPSCRTDLPRVGIPGFAVPHVFDATPAHRPRHRPHRRHRPRLRPPARRARLRPRPGRPRPRPAGDGRRRAARTRTASQVEVLPADLTDRAGWPWSRPGSPTPPARSTCWSTTPASGSSAGSSTTPSTQEQALLDVLVTAVMRLSHAALGAMTERGSRRHHQRLERGGVPAARHATAPRRPG